MYKDEGFLYTEDNEKIRRENQWKTRYYLPSAGRNELPLIAHDGKKKELMEWCMKNKEILSRHFLCGTGTTARMIADYTGLPVKGYSSGPLGGDQQIGARDCRGEM